MSQTWATALHEYRHWRLVLTGHSPHTVKGEQPGLTWFADFMESIDIDVVSMCGPEHAAMWWEALDHLQPATRATRLAQLRSFLRFCVHKGWLSADPTLLLRARPVVHDPRLRLTADELLTVIDCAGSQRDRIVLALAVNLALRGGEISRLRIADVNLAANEMTVRVDKTHEIDIMPINADLRIELEQWLDHYQDNGTVLSNSFLVPSMYTGPTAREVYRSNRIYSEPYRAVQQALRRAGFVVPRGEGVHTVRRSMARVYFDYIEDETSFDSALVATMSLLHHSRPETTLHYVGRNRASLARDRILKGKPFLRKLAPAHTLRAVG